MPCHWQAPRLSRGQTQLQQGQFVGRCIAVCLYMCTLLFGVSAIRVTDLFVLCLGDEPLRGKGDATGVVGGGTTRRVQFGFLVDWLGEYVVPQAEPCAGKAVHSGDGNAIREGVLVRGLFASGVVKTIRRIGWAQFDATSRRREMSREEALRFRLRIFYEEADRETDNVVKPDHGVPFSDCIRLPEQVSDREAGGREPPHAAEEQETVERNENQAMQESVRRATSGKSRTISVNPSHCV